MSKLNFSREKKHNLFPNISMVSSAKVDWSFYLHSSTFGISRTQERHDFTQQHQYCSPRFVLMSVEVGRWVGRRGHAGTIAQTEDSSERLSLKAAPEWAPTKVSYISFTNSSSFPTVGTKMRQPHLSAGLECRPATLGLGRALPRLWHIALVLLFSQFIPEGKP